MNHEALIYETKRNFGFVLGGRGPGGSLNVFHLHTMGLFVRLFVEIDYQNKNKWKAETLALDRALTIPAEKNLSFLYFQRFKIFQRKCKNVQLLTMFNVAM